MAVHLTAVSKRLTIDVVAEPNRFDLCRRRE